MSIIFTRTAFTAAQLLDSSTKQNFRQKKVEQCDKRFTNDMEEGQKCPVHHHHHQHLCASVWILLAGFYDLAPEEAKCLKLRPSENSES
jgi:hypothetical protein